MNTELDILRDVSERLDSAGIEFMVTGSMAMNYYAQPRMTRDIDVVMALEKSDTVRLINLFSEEYYIDQQAVDRAITQRSIFNLIHQDSVIKVDAIVRKDDAYREEEFARRQRVTIADFETWIVSVEDLILSKLYWARDSRSELQLRDVRNLLELDCDRKYLRSRAQILGVEQLLDELLAEE
ncbi:MAG TPA: nucleotidyltransferase [Pyrinomonadaceae bacterium]|nr:nucleotidyltransferase [Pyrinomonadaceae bacterium]